MIEASLQDLLAGLWPHLRKGPELAAVIEMDLAQLHKLVEGKYRSRSRCTS